MPKNSMPSLDTRLAALLAPKEKKDDLTSIANVLMQLRKGKKDRIASAKKLQETITEPKAILSTVSLSYEDIQSLRNMIRNKPQIHLASDKLIRCYEKSEYVLNGHSINSIWHVQNDKLWQKVLDKMKKPNTKPLRRMSVSVDNRNAKITASYRAASVIATKASRKRIRVNDSPQRRVLQKTFTTRPLYPERSETNHNYGHHSRNMIHCGNLFQRHGTAVY